MKKVLAIFLLVGLTTVQFAQQQPAGDQPKDSQNIVVGGDQGGPQTTGSIKTVTTRKGYVATTSIPETVTTVTSPEKVYVQESQLAWLSLGIRTSVDYHLTPKSTTLAPLWLYGELHNTTWGVQLGLGYLSMPVNTYTDSLGTTYNGTGSQGYINIDLLGKYYLWFAKWLWVGLGMNESVLMGGQIKWWNNAATALAANPTAAQQPNSYASWTDIMPGGGIFYLQGGIGAKIAVGSGFSHLSIDPEFRVLYPLNAPTGYGSILRFNIGVSYAFGL